MWPIVNFKHDQCDVYIGRPSKYGNPFHCGLDGTREEVIERYENWLQENPELIKDICRELQGKILGCWCHPLECHGDVIVRIANNWQLARPLI